MLNTSRDRSTIDFAYFPLEGSEAATSTSVMRVPILPNNYSERDMSERHEPMVDNHAADIDHFDLTKHVTNAASKVVDAGTEQIETNGGAMRSLWEGLMDDVFGERKVAHPPSS